MRLRNRVLLAFAVALCLAFVARNAIAQRVVTFHSPHVVRAPRAALDTGLTTRIDAAAKAAALKTPKDLVTFALRQSAAQLHFGLSHRTRLSFDESEREGNCVEYAELFATIVNRERGGLDVRAWPVRSDASILGQTIPNPAWRDHDWVLVVINGTDRLYVDPTLYDFGFGYDVSTSVHGVVTPPRVH